MHLQNANKTTNAADKLGYFGKYNHTLTDLQMPLYNYAF